MEEIIENEMLQTDTWVKYSDKAIELLMEYGPKVVLAIVLLLVGLRIINAAVKAIGKGMHKRNVDETLRPFLVNILNWGLKALLVISVASMVGIETTSFVAVLGAAGLAVGLALQGTLANFAGGVLLLVFKPFKVGDLIEAAGFLGEVEEIQIFITKINTPQNRQVIIPNSVLSNGSLTNLSAKGFVRVDLTVGISYNSNIKVAKDLLLKVMQDHSMVLKDPAPFVGVAELADSSVNLAVRPHCKPEDYWDVYFDITEAAKLTLDENGIEIPFPQRDVHLYKHEA